MRGMHTLSTIWDAAPDFPNWSSETPEMDITATGNQLYPPWLQEFEFEANYLTSEAVLKLVLTSFKVAPQ